MNQDRPLPPCLRRKYDVSETQPFHVASKVHEAPTLPRFDRHYALEIGIVLSGRMERFYEGHQRALRPGQVWLCSAWEPHGWRVAQAPCRAVVTSIFPATLATSRFPELARQDWCAAFAVPAARRPDAPAESRKLVQHLGRSLLASTAAPEPQRQFLQRMLVYRLLLELPLVLPAAEAEALREEEWGSFNRAVELVFQRRCFISTEDAARQCAVAPKVLNALFRSATGASFPRFALSFRLQAAASQLLESRDPVKAVALDWGFTDVGHFATAFRGAYGCTPIRYRERCGQSASERDDL